MAENDNNYSLHGYLSGSVCTTDGIAQFLRMGVSINSEDEDCAGETPLHYAVCNENCSSEVIKYLLDNGANTSAGDNDDLTPLHYLVQNDARKNAIDVACLLLDYGAEVDGRDDWSRTALHYAVGNPSSNSIDIVKLLLHRGANLHAICSISRPALDYAIFGGDYDFTKLLLDLGANVNYTNTNGSGALHSAAQYCNPRIIKLLISYGALVNVVNSCNISPLYTSVHYNKRESSKLLLDYGALVSCGKSPLEEAIGNYNLHKDEATLKHLQLLLKYTLFENAVLNMEDEYSNSRLPEELMEYRSECLLEINKMRLVSLENTMLLQFVFQLRQELQHKDKDDINRILKKLLMVIYGNAFPLYNEVIIGLIKKEYLLDNLENLLVYAVSSQMDTFSGCLHTVVLRLDDLRVLARSLSGVDLLNLMLAFYDSHDSCNS